MALFRKLQETLGTGLLFWFAIFLLLCVVGFVVTSALGIWVGETQTVVN